MALLPVRWLQVTLGSFTAAVLLAALLAAYGFDAGTSGAVGVGGGLLLTAGAVVVGVVVGGGVAGIVWVISPLLSFMMIAGACP